MDVLLASARSDLRFALEVLLREQPGMNVAGTATGTEGLLALIGTTFPDLVIFDWELPGAPPTDVLAGALARHSPPYVIALGRDEATRKVALSAGADAYVLRGDPPDRLLAAVQGARSTPIAPSGQPAQETKGE